MRLCRGTVLTALRGRYGSASGRQHALPQGQPVFHTGGRQALERSAHEMRCGAGRGETHLRSPCPQVLRPDR